MNAAMNAPMNDPRTTTIGIIGGTGPHGRGLAHRFGAAGHPVLIGSRDADRASHVAADVSDRLKHVNGAGPIAGTTNPVAIAGATIVVVAVPFDALAVTLDDLEFGDRIIVSCVNPLAFDKAGPRPLMVDAGSAAEHIAQRARAARVVAAFHHVSAVSLRDEDGPLDEHVLVAGDDPAAKRTVIDLARCVAARGGIDAGPLRSAGALEALTAVLIHVNRTYATHAGVAITGLGSRDDALALFDSGG